MSEQWTYIRRLQPGGHKLFHNQKEQYAIADDSGAYPQLTDDGILWVDTTKPIIVPPEGWCELSLLDEKGAICGTLVGLEAAIFLQEKLDMEIHFKGKLGCYQIQTARL